MANFNFVNLTDSVRGKMLSEVEMDISKGNIYISGRLNELGIEKYVEFLKESIENGTEEILEALIRDNNCLNDTEISNGKTKKVPSNAAQLIDSSK